MSIEKNRYRIFKYINVGIITACIIPSVLIATNTFATKNTYITQAAQVEKKTVDHNKNGLADEFEIVQENNQVDVKLPEDKTAGVTKDNDENSDKQTVKK